MSKRDIVDQKKGPKGCCLIFYDWFALTILAYRMGNQAHLHNHDVYGIPDQPAGKVQSVSCNCGYGPAQWIYQWHRLWMSFPFQLEWGMTSCSTISVILTFDHARLLTERKETLTGMPKNRELSWVPTSMASLSQCFQEAIAQRDMVARSWYCWQP